MEFRPIPGLSGEWAAGAELDIRSPIWDLMGTYPLLVFIALYFMMIGIG